MSRSKNKYDSQSKSEYDKKLIRDQDIHSKLNFDYNLGSNYKEYSAHRNNYSSNGKDKIDFKLSREIKSSPLCNKDQRVL